jgi:hypothetical protein
MASAASRRQPPAKTARRANRRRSSSPSSAWLQSMAPRSVCWREGKSRGPPVSNISRCSSRSSNACGVSSRTRAPASSIASGSPSRRTQISATAGAFSLVTSKSARTDCARSMNSATASYCETASCEAPGIGRASGGTWYSCSPESRSGARLVTSSLTRVGEKTCRNSGAASRSCSKLSSTSRRRRPPRK